MLKYFHKETKMVKHIILWTLKEMSDSEKASVKQGIKEGLEGLKGYSKHPEHVAVADAKVRPFTASRACLDFEI